MTKRRTVFFIAGAVIAMAAILISVSPLVRALLYLGVVENLNPGDISWDGKTAWQRCESAIAGRSNWPDGAQATCAAMHMCVNEASLSEAQMNLLLQKFRSVPGCSAP